MPSNTHANDASLTVIRIRVGRTGIVVIRQQYPEFLADIIDRVILITVNVLRALETHGDYRLQDSIRFTKSIEMFGPK